MPTIPPDRVPNSTRQSMPRPRHSMCTRLLASMMPADCYAKNDRTMDSMSEFVASDLQGCFHTGVKESHLNSYVFILSDSYIPIPIFEALISSLCSCQNLGEWRKLLAHIHWNQRRLAFLEKSNVASQRANKQTSLPQVRRT